MAAGPTQTAGVTSTTSGTASDTSQTQDDKIFDALVQSVAMQSAGDLTSQESFSDDEDQ